MTAAGVLGASRRAALGARAASSAAHADSRPLLFLLGHGALAVVLSPAWSAPLATLHAAIVVAAALGAAALAPRRLAVAAAAYVAACDVLWRLTGAMMPWEGGKYLVALTLLVAMARTRARPGARVLPVVYFAVLLPAVLVLAADPFMDGGDIVDRVSFNLSGPLALAVGTLYLSGRELDDGALRRVLVALLAPLLTIGGIAFVRTITAADLRFTAESSFATSGGFGPNQVSSVLGLGAFVALVLALRAPPRTRLAWAAAAVAGGLALQSALTLSRGGLYAAGIAAAVTAAGLLRDARARRRLVLGAIPAFVLAVAVVVPRLDTFTSGALGARFADRASSGRTAIVREDLRLWFEHPVLGTGPGRATELRRTQSRVSHTEYTRLLAEHGAFGIVALLCLVLLAARVLRRGIATPGTAIAAGLLVWSLASMTHAGMRVAVFGFVFALAQARLRAAPRVEARPRAR